MDQLYRLRHPWTQYRAPFKIAENVFFVGTDWVSAFLLDTEKGLVLIDCAMQETLYLVVDSIRALGYDPRKISKLLLTHGHYDHCGAARSLYEMSGCEIWLGKPDEFFFTEDRRQIFFEDRVPEFPIHRFYEYGKAIDLGNFQVLPVNCPGHTPGTTSFFFEVKAPAGTGKEKLTCGLHGGLGEITLLDEYLAWNGFGREMRRTFCDSIDKVIDMSVDIVLPSHADHGIDYDFYKLASEDDRSGRAFIDEGAWKRMLSVRRAVVQKLIDGE